nr:hypothetical protein [Frankia sp. Cas3]
MVQGTQVAEWAGHSVAVLYRVYAKCIDGGVDTQLCRIEAALGIERGHSAAVRTVDGSVPRMVREPSIAAGDDRTPPDTTGSGS